jgi:Flp pilus assembly CpaF family ATPase
VRKSAQIANEALKDSVYVPPTVYVDQGTPIIDFVRHDRRLIELLKGRDIGGFLRLAVRGRVSMVISGGTSTDKTTFLNAVDGGAED